MRNNNVAINVNKHVEITSAEVIKNRNGNMSVISFSNLAKENIKAIMFEAKGYDIFGDLVKVDGNDSFDISVKEYIFVEKNCSWMCVQKLPSDDIDRIELQEKTIVYNDGSKCSYEGEKEVVFQAEEFEDNDNEKEALSFLRETVSPSINYIPINGTGDYWLCGCGRHNSSADSNCIKCNTAKDVIDNMKKSIVIKTLPQGHKKVAMTKERRKINFKRKVMGYAKAFVAIAAIILIIVCVDYISKFKAGPYNNSFKIYKPDWYGVYICETPEVTKAIIIDGDRAYIEFYVDGINHGGRGTEIDWQAVEAGDDCLFEDYYISGHGNIVNGSDVYKKVSDKRDLEGDIIAERLSK